MAESKKTSMFYGIKFLALTIRAPVNSQYISLTANHISSYFIAIQQ